MIISHRFTLLQIFEGIGVVIMTSYAVVIAVHVQQNQAD